MENTVVIRTLHKNVSWEEFQILRKKPVHQEKDHADPQNTAAVSVTENRELDVPMLQKMLHTFENRISEKGKLYVAPNIPERSLKAAVKAFGSPMMGSVYALLDTSALGTASRGILFAENLLAVCEGRNVYYLPYREMTGVYPEDRAVPATEGAIVFRNKDFEQHIRMDGLNKLVLVEILNRSVMKLRGYSK